MTFPVFIDLYIAAMVSQVVLMFFATYFAYQITRIVGSFWIWTLMILIFGLLALRQSDSVVVAFVTPMVRLIAETDRFALTSYWPGAIINEIAYGALATLAYGLSRMLGKKAVEVTSGRRDRREGIAAFELYRVSKVHPVIYFPSHVRS